MKHHAPQFTFPGLPEIPLTLEPETVVQAEPIKGDDTPALFPVPPSFAPKALKPQTKIKGDLL